MLKQQAKMELNSKNLYRFTSNFLEKPNNHQTSKYLSRYHPDPLLLFPLSLCPSGKLLKWPLGRKNIGIAWNPMTGLRHVYPFGNGTHALPSAGSAHLAHQLIPSCKEQVSFWMDKYIYSYKSHYKYSKQGHPAMCTKLHMNFAGETYMWQGPRLECFKAEK